MHRPRGKIQCDSSIVETTASNSSHVTSNIPSDSNRWKRPWKKSAVISPVPSERQPSHECKAGFWSSLFFLWVGPLMTTGYRRVLELNDIWLVNPDRSVDKFNALFNSHYQHTKADSTRLNPLTRALYLTFRRDIWLGGLAQLVTGCCQVLTPFLLRYVILFAEETFYASMRGRAAPSLGRGVGLVLAITVLQIVQSVCNNHAIYWSMTLGGQVRATLISATLDKSLKLSPRATAGSSQSADTAQDMGQHEGWSTARINNLMSTDTSRIDLASATIHRCWTSPIQVVLTLGLLCVNLGYSALAGFALVCTLTPLVAMVIKSLAKRRKAINVITDDRVRLTQEAISSVRSIKLLGWEGSFLRRIAEVRAKELHKIVSLLSIRNAVLAVAVVTPVLASMLSFVTYSLTGHNLSAANVFSSLALFNVLGVPLEVLPLAIGRTIDAVASLRRLSLFLGAEELDQEASWDLTGDTCLQVTDATFTWERQASIVDTESSGPELEMAAPFKLANVNLSLQRNELIAVIGKVGSGKTSLLSALAGEMRKESGLIAFSGSRAFCSQSPWLQNASIRDNITFAQDFEQDRFDAVVDACALRKDLETLPSGDLTEVGERGITLSGGQKQRVSLARALYCNADIVIMDDPLSAVDAHSGQHIVQNAICGELMQEKCRIIATHQWQILPRTDRVIWMKDGKVHAVSSYEDLLESSDEFRRMMQNVVDNLSGSSQAQAEPQSNVAAAVHTRPAAALMREEDQATRSIGTDVYRGYIKASGSLWKLPFALSVVVIAQSSNILTNLWLSWWSSNRFNLNTTQYIAIYVGLGILQSCLMFCFGAVFTVLGARSSRSIYQRALANAMRAPISFFDTTPLGRILNRFTRDIDVVDNTLSDSLRMFAWMIALMTSVFGLILAYYCYFAIALFPLLGGLLFAANYYRSSAREIKRHEAVLRSLVFARFSEAIAGAATLRAYNVEQRFLATLNNAIDSMDGAYFLTFANQRWLSARVDAVGTLLVFIVGILVITSRFDVNPNIGGLVLAYTLTIVATMQLFVRQIAEVDNNMNSMERLHHYCEHLEQETDTSSSINPHWPHRGHVNFDAVSMRYRPDLPLALHNLSLTIQPGEHIGIVGRTGAGKSSVISSLMRLTELSEGSITIDGIDISTVDLHRLRSTIAIIPQDPVLFRGTIRSNIDPTCEHSDLDLYRVLERVGLRERDQQGTSRSVDLEMEVMEEGLNLSLGQKQLLALARALIRNSRITVCDEATSSVDVETDLKVQRIMAEQLKGRMLLCVAHRLSTVIHYDRIVVIDAGRVVEFDTPLALFHAGGVFRSLCDRSGLTEHHLLSAQG